MCSCGGEDGRAQEKKNTLVHFQHSVDCHQMVDKRLQSGRRSHPRKKKYQVVFFLTFCRLSLDGRRLVAPCSREDSPNPPTPPHTHTFKTARYTERSLMPCSLPWSRILIAAAAFVFLLARDRLWMRRSSSLVMRPRSSCDISGGAVQSSL